MAGRKPPLTDEHAQDVQRVAKVLIEGDESFAILRHRPVLPQRGNIPFMRVMDQAMDGVNVVALELTIGKNHMADIRRLDKKLEERVHRWIRAFGNRTDHGTEFIVPVRLVAIIG